jgi:hypothetical protein
MGMDLGDLGGEPRADLDVTFGYFGHTVRVNPHLSDLVMLDFMTKAADLDEDSTEAMGAMTALLRGVVHADDWETFWAAAIGARQGIDDLMRVCMGVIEAVADRPTVPPSDSSGGPPSTDTRSAAVSSSAAIQRQLEQDGRPDLALMVQQSRQHRESLPA